MRVLHLAIALWKIKHFTRPRTYFYSTPTQNKNSRAMWNQKCDLWKLRACAPEQFRTFRDSAMSLYYNKITENLNTYVLTTHCTYAAIPGRVYSTTIGSWGCWFGCVPKGVKATTTSSAQVFISFAHIAGVCYQRGWRSVLMTHMEVLSELCSRCEGTSTTHSTQY